MPFRDICSSALDASKCAFGCFSFVKFPTGNMGGQPPSRPSPSYKCCLMGPDRCMITSCAPYGPTIWSVSIIEEKPVDTISTILVLHSSCCQCTLNDVTTLYPPTPYVTHHHISLNHLPLQVWHHLWTSPNQEAFVFEGWRMVSKFEVVTLLT